MDSSGNEPDYGEDVLGYTMSEQPQELLDEITDPEQRRLANRMFIGGKPAEPQQWTPENLWFVLGLAGPIDIVFQDLICDAHNAALAAAPKNIAWQTLEEERKRFEQQLTVEQEKLTEAYDFNERLSKINDSLRTEVAAERDSWDISPTIRKLREQVKLLVDALEAIRKCARVKTIYGIADDALAKVTPYPLPDGPTNRGRLRDASMKSAKPGQTESET